MPIRLHRPAAPGLSARPSPWWRKLWLIGLLLGLIPGAIGGIFLGAKSAEAALQLAYFDPIAQADRVRVTWGTTQEYDLLGYRVYCKEENQPDSAYHPIGGIITATGSLTETADYSLNAFGLVRGVSYCFQLQEITSNGDPGEIFVRCGYGLNITPTPLPSPTPTVTPTPSETPTATPTATPTPLFSPTPTATETPIPSPTPTATLTPEPGSPTPPYVVHTATFTATPVRQPQATFTPLPPPTPLAAELFRGLLAPPNGTPVPTPSLVAPGATDSAVAHRDRPQSDADSTITDDLGRSAWRVHANAKQG